LNPRQKKNNLGKKEISFPEGAYGKIELSTKKEKNSRKNVQSPGHFGPYGVGSEAYDYEKKKGARVQRSLHPQPKRGKNPQPPTKKKKKNSNKNKRPIV